LLVCLWLADTGISVLIQHSRLRKKLTAHLESDFGRPVEVGSYAFSLWSGPALEARSVIVSEDPRFGHEYFLRSESLTVRLRWQSLLHGRLELGTLALEHPSLNIVRNASGDWNIASWLPRVSGSSAAYSHSNSRRESFRKIEVDGGRINFKRGDEKLPFAFVGVAGRVETDLPDLWRINLAAVPWRAAEIIQQAGTIHVAGHVGGTSSRLLPAALDLSWTDASISDVLRLSQNYDHGIRGTMALLLNARTQGESWILQGRVELRQIHRWDLPIRSDNPALNLIAKMKVSPEASGLEVNEAILETPHSNAHASGSISWTPPSRKTNPASLPTPILEVNSAAVDLGDVLSWVRAFHSDVAEDISLSGMAGFDATFAGWPPRLSGATITSPGAELRGMRLRVPVRLGQIAFHYQDQRISMPPATLAFGALNGPAAGFLKADITPARGQNKKPADTHITGNLNEVRDLIATAGELGWNISQGWDLAGPLRFDLRWRGQPVSWPAQPVGFVELGVGAAKSVDANAASLHVPYLNQPIQQIVGRVDWTPNERHITLAAAEAFGAEWKGTLDRRDSADGWQFALSADRITSADLDRWLNPRWHQSFLYRMLPFLDSSVAGKSIPENLRANGSISLDQFTLTPLVIRRLNGDLDIEGRHIRFTDAEGQLYGGQVTGEFDANLQSSPRYEANVGYDGVDLSALSGASAALSGLFDGSASGAGIFSTHGTSRADLLASMECRGTVQARGVKLSMIDLTASLGDEARRPGTSAFPRASASFACKDRKLQFQGLALSGSGPEIDGSGILNPDRTLDFQLGIVPDNLEAPRTSPVSTDSLPSRPNAELFRLTGPLSAPEVTRIPASTPRRP